MVISEYLRNTFGISEQNASTIVHYWAHSIEEYISEDTGISQETVDECIAYLNLEWAWVL